MSVDIASFYETALSSYRANKELSTFVDDLVQGRPTGQIIERINSDPKKMEATFSAMNFTFEYFQRLEKHFHDVVLLRAKEIAEQPSYKSLFEVFEIIMKFYNSQTSFYDAVSENPYFSNLGETLEAVFSRIVQLELTSDPVYSALLKLFLKEQFESWTTMKARELSTSQQGISELRELGLINSSSQVVQFDESIWTSMLGFLEKFKLTTSLLKTNLEQVLVSRLEEVISRLLEISLSEGDEVGDGIHEHDRMFKMIRPWAELYLKSFVKPFIFKLDDLRNMFITVKRRQESKRFSTRFIDLIETDFLYIFVKKLGCKILDFVLDFESCIDKIKELGEAAEKVNMSDDVCAWLRESIEKRLLTPGVTTSSIISTYFNIVLTQKIIDPDMLNLSSVTSNIKKFMKNRTNLVRSIISFWKEMK